MAIIRCSVRLASLTGLLEDETVNVWHFNDTPAVLEKATADVLGGFIATFYQNTVLAPLWGHSIPRAQMVHRVDVATVVSTTTGPDDDVVSKVIGGGAFSITPIAPTTVVPLPSEVAIAMSFAGDLEGFVEESGATRPRSRRRGRLFLGPWTESVVEKQVAGYAAVSPACRDAILDSYALTIASINSMPTNPRHVIYSVTNGNVVEVESVSVDTAFDTIRSRGYKAILRETRAVAQT